MRSYFTALIYIVCQLYSNGTHLKNAVIIEKSYNREVEEILPMIAECVMKKSSFTGFIFSFLLIPLIFSVALAQKNKPKSGDDKGNVRVVTIPISIYTKKELKENQAQEFVQADNLTVIENQEEMTILSIRSVSNTPLALAVLVQDDLSSNVNLQLKQIGEFIRELPQGSRVMVAYLRGGSTQIRQKFTLDLDKAANSLRIVVGNQAVAPRSPYDGVNDVLDRFEALPNGRRAILLISDGLDTSNGLSATSAIRSNELERAILKAQKRSVAVYSFYSTGSFTENAGSSLITAAQGSLLQLSKETGGRAFFQGTSSPISFKPFFQDLGILLKRQFAVTYLSPNFKKGYYKVKVTSSNPDLEIEHPKGYYFRK
jgi:VWFA-related protein